MAISDVQVPAPVVITDGASPVSIGSISQVSLQLNNNIIREVAGGQVYQSLPRIARVAPVASFTTWSLAEAFDNLNVFRKCLSAASYLEMYTATRECGGNKAGSTHTKYTITNGIIVPRTLRVDHTGHCSMSYEVYAHSADGAAAPFTQSLTSALPASFGDNNSRWTINACVIDANSILDKQSISIDFGVNLIQRGGDSNVYDTFTGMRSAQPRVTITTINPDEFATVGLSGLTAAHADSHIYFKKRGVADGTEEHIGITWAGLATMETVFDAATDGDGATTSIVCDPYYDGTNAPFLVDTTQALS
jgi:hypothetical protein